MPRNFEDYEAVIDQAIADLRTIQDLEEVPEKRGEHECFIRVAARNIRQVAQDVTEAYKANHPRPLPSISEVALELLKTMSDSDRKMLMDQLKSIKPV